MAKFLVFVFLLYLFGKSESADETIDEIYKFVYDGYENIRFPSGTDYILVTGETGIGKTPFSKWITIDNSLLEAAQEVEYGPFLMKDDDGRIGSQLTESATIYPDLYPKNDSTVYYDFPGFRDTRGPKYELGITYFIRRVVNKAKRLKILFLTDFDAVKRNAGRQKLTSALDDICSFIKNVDKFRSSVATVVTKVPKYINGDDLNDVQIINYINSSITSIKDELKKKAENACRVQLIEILTKNIGIFRFPDKAGPFSEIEILRPGKLHIEDIIANKLTFVKTNEHDFGYSISADSKLFVKVLLYKILNSKCAEDVFEMCDRINNKYMELINTVTNIERLNESISVGVAMLDKMSDNDPLIFIDKLVHIANRLNLNSISMDSVNNSLEYIAFLLQVENSTLTTPPEYVSAVTNITRQITKKYDEHIDTELENLLEQDFSIDFKIICSEIQSYHLQIQKLTNDIDIIRQNSINISRVLKNIQGNVNITKNPLIYFKELINSANILNIGISPSILEPIAVRLNNLEFIYRLRNKTESSSLEMIQIVDKLLNQIEDSIKLYNFLDILFNNFEFPEDEAKPVIEACIDVRDDSLMNITELHLPQLLKDSQTILESIKDLKFNSFQIKALKKVLIILTENPDTKCSNKKNMLVRGMSIKLSKVIGDPCWNDATSINIFALKSINIDVDVNKIGEIAQLTIISPVWRISGQRKIILNGEDKLGIVEAAQNGKGISVPGHNGKAGEPGGPGGNFFGIGEKFVDGHLLEILSNGGRGANGQQGGDGDVGTNGEDPPVPNCDESFFDCVDDACQSCAREVWDGKFDYTVTFHHKGGIEGVRTDKNYVLNKWKVYGTKGKKPGNGGNGGDRGAGGNPGNIEIIELKDPPNYIKYTNHGEPGAIGKCGKGAASTQDSAVKSIVQTPRGWRWQRSYYEESSQIPELKSSNGNDGVGINEVGRQKAIPFSTLSFIINAFKSYCKEKITDTNYGIRENHIKTFLDRITDNPKVFKLYDLFGYINEFDSMEQQYLELKSKLNFVPFLKKFLGRIVKFSNVFSSIHHPNVKRKVLSHLYTCTLSKLYTERNKIGENTIYDLKMFLKDIKADLIDLNKKKSNEIINSYRDAFKESLDKKIDDAKTFIDVDIKSEVNKIFETIDNHIAVLLEGIIENENSAVTDLVKLHKQKHELEKTMKMRLALAPLKFAAPFISSFGPGMAAVGGALTLGSSVVENLVLDDKSGEGSDKISTIKGTYFEPMRQLTNQINNGYNVFKAQVTEIDNEIKKYEGTPQGTAIPTELNLEKLRKEIDECKNIIKKRGNDGDANNWSREREKLANLIVEHKTALEQRKSKIESDDPLIKQQISAQIKWTGHLTTGLNTMEAGIDVYNRYRNDKAKVEKMGDAIGKQKAAIENLRKREKRVYDIGIPYIRSVKDDIDHFEASNLSAQLMVKKWKLQNMFRDLRLEFSRMAKDFPIDEEIQLCLSKVDEGMTTMIDIYDRINSYSETQQMVNYIANVQSANSENIALPEDLRYPVNRLNNIIKSNLLIEKLDMAIRATKQHYFPMIINFFQRYKLPKELQTDDTDSVKEAALQQVDDLLKTINAATSISTEYDDYSHYNAIFNGTVNEPAFYRWPYAKFENEIKKLLNGESVTINADIVNGVDFNAVKFQNIHFKLKNESRQNEFDGKFANLVTNMTMFGTNYYRCHNRIYSIGLDRNIVIDFSYENMQWKNPNLTFKKIQDNSAFLSPYGMWQIQISGNLTDFATFQNETIDLELLGSGSYIKHGEFTNRICNSQLDNFYSFYKLISE